MKPPPYWLLCAIPLLLAADSGPARTTVQIEIPPALTNLFKPRFVDSKPAPDFQIVEIGELNLKRAILLDRHSGDSWHYDHAIDAWVKLHKYTPLTIFENYARTNKTKRPISAEDFLNDTNIPRSALDKP